MELQYLTYFLNMVDDDGWVGYAGSRREDDERVSLQKTFRCHSRAEYGEARESRQRQGWIPDIFRLRDKSWDCILSLLQKNDCFAGIRIIYDRACPVINWPVGDRSGIGFNPDVIMVPPVYVLKAWMVERDISPHTSRCSEPIRRITYG